ncbi:hypothetical protein ACRAWF_19530 [Streptomyces sp. L7]
MRERRLGVPLLVGSLLLNCRGGDVAATPTTSRATRSRNFPAPASPDPRDAGGRRAARRSATRTITVGLVLVVLAAAAGNHWFTDKRTAFGCEGSRMTGLSSRTAARTPRRPAEHGLTLQS